MSYKFKNGDIIKYDGCNEKIKARPGARAKVWGMSHGKYNMFISLMWFKENPTDEALVNNQCDGGYLPKYFKKIGTIHCKKR